MTLQVYFDSKPPKYIRRTQEIPLDLESFMLKVEARLVKIEEFVDEKRDIHLLGMSFWLLFIRRS